MKHAEPDPLLNGYAISKQSYVAVQRTQHCRSEFPANYALRRFNVPRPFLLLPRVPTLLHCDAFATDFTAAQFRAFHCTRVSCNYFRFARYAPKVTTSYWTKTNLEAGAGSKTAVLTH
ncbi:hypothetical protein EVAR_54257_1 [Eumeta japonica]|uniref:Uncharacterized protein n=1 Tax=Eumeta variegata TaxID=151549 RepID=A0A4C1YKR4_EUMVA|nr:hypothetical protein EVAR_54257_1 [Eumeta japonica]